MKNIIISVVFTCLIVKAEAQRDTIINGKEAIITSNGLVVSIGDDLKCVRGTLPDGDYKYIHSSSKSWSVVLNGTNSLHSLGRRFDGLKVNVKKINKVGNNKRGYKYFLIVGTGDIVNYELEIESALATGEVITVQKL